MDGRNILRPLVGLLILVAVSLAAHGAWNIQQGAAFEAATSTVTFTDTNADQAWAHNEARANQLTKTSTAGVVEVWVAIGLVALAIGTYYYRRKDGITLREIAAMF
ncbi:hypothetical protein C0581_01380 [Candidatus Parcubacteria bacterium]|nr:MAG: hypothetical protein C0581_01380 [Candidatus Parcubacteria bacterium]